MRTTLPLTEFPGANPLLLAYAQSQAGVARMFDYSPHDPQAISQRLRELDERVALDVLRSIDRGAWVAAVYAQQQRYGAGTPALAAARALAQPGTCAVICGQQAGLFGGPLYTQHKALTVIKLARQLELTHPGRRFVPMFWISSGDSDFDEVRRAHLLDRAGQVRELALPAGPPEAEGRIVGVRDVRRELDAALAELELALPGGEQRDAVLAAVREAYAEGGMVEGFARFMARLFAGTELLLIDPQDPMLMQAARGLIRRELDDPAGCEQALLARNAQIGAAGFGLQVDHLPGDTNLFLLDADGRREKIAFDGGGFVLRPSGRRIDARELAAIADVTPERFVCGVMLRPLYQNVLFPAAAWVGGAAEIAYRTQATAVFAHYGERMAPAFYRASATLLPGKSAELLDELGWELAECFGLPQDLAGRAVAGLRPQAIDDALARYRTLLNDADGELKALAMGLDQSLGETFDTLRGNLERHVEKLEKKVTSALKQKQEVLLRRVALVQAQVYPRLAPQERVLGILSFLPRYGFELIERLLDALSVPSWEHQVVVLD